MFYFLVLLILFLFGLLDVFKSEAKKYSTIYFFIIFCFIILGSIRWRTGIDWETYENNFNAYESIQDFLLGSGFEKGWVYLNYYAKKLTGSYTTVLMVFTLICVGIKAYIFQKNTTSVLLLALLLFGFTVADITATRQMAAISIGLIGVNLALEKKYIKYIIVTSIAMLFHNSAAILFLAYPVIRYNLSIKLKSILLIIALILSLIHTEDIIVTKLADLLQKVYPPLATKLYAYYYIGKEEIFGMGINKTQQNTLAILKRLIIVPFIFLYENKISQERPVYKAYSNLFFLGILIYFIIGGFPALQRMASYFYIYEIILLAMIFDHVKYKTILYFLLFLYCAFKLYTLLMVQWDYNVPYQTIFSHDAPRPYR